MLTGVRIHRFNVVGGKEACGPVDLSFPPIRVILVQDVDQLTTGEAQLILVSSCVVV